MRHLSIGLVALAVFLLAPFCYAQQGGGLPNNASGSSTAGFAGLSNSGGAGGVSTSGFSLSSRFQSNFSKYTGGSQSIGQNTAGAAAATAGVFGQTAGSTGRGGLTGSTRGGLGSFGNFGSSFGLGSLGYGMGGFGRGGFGRSSYGRSSFGRNGQNSANKMAIRTHLRLGPELAQVRREYVASAAPAAIKAVSTRLNKIIARSGQTAAPIGLEVKDGRVVLRGHVQTEHARTLAENLVRLEPGIWEVENELIVDPAAPKPATEQKPSVVDQPQ